MPAPHSFETFTSTLGDLVARFAAGAPDFLSRRYDEASLRQDFLNPFLRALGWDLENNARLILSRREVEIESRTIVAGRKKRADYLFRTDGTDRFVCEAKKPFEALGSAHAFQAKRYGWNKEVPLSLLTDFEELCIYIVAARPALSDPVEIGLWRKWHYTEFPTHAREIWDLLSRDAVAGGSIDRLLDTLPKKPSAAGRARQLWLIRPDRSRALDTDFLNFLDEARRTLGSDLLRHNPHAGLREDHARLNEAVQTILDRLLFLRICEDRDIDTGTNLHLEVENWRSASGRPSPSRARQSFLPAVGEEPPPPTGTPNLSTRLLWPGLVAHFRALDRRPASHVPYFNGHLFKPHFTENLAVGDDWLATFLDDLSSDESPYLFAIIPVEILGTIYERFLGKVIRPHGLGVTIEEKPEVRKAGGVYYTPRYIVDYIVEQTVGKLLADQQPEKTLALRFLDPACGSGSFLIRVFERVCEHWLVWLTANPKARKDSLCWTEEATGDVHLTAALKRRILTANIYGVDLDPGAVEVTQLSLYLKMLEGANRNTLARERELFAAEAEPALLPPLAANIKCGNSLIASDFSLDPDDLIRVRAFDWDVQFAVILKAGGFDAVVGNPPWGADLDPQVLKYLSGSFSRVVQRMIDSYIYFFDQALRLARKAGVVGFVIPSTVLNQVDAKPLRRLLIESGLRCVVNLGKDIFTKKVLNTTTLIATAGGTQPDTLIVGDLSHLPLKQRELALAQIGPVQAKFWLEDVQADPATTFFANADERTALLRRLRQQLKPLNDYTVGGIARGVSPDIAEPHVIADSDPLLRKMEREVLRRSISGKHIKRYAAPVADQWLIYTRKGMNPKKFPNALARLETCRHQNTCSEVKEGKHPWWALHRARDPEIFASPKLIGLTTTKSIEIVLDEEQNLVVTDAMYVFRLRDGISPRAALGILHSKLFAFLYRVSNQGESRVIPQIKAAKLEPLPFPNLTERADRTRHDRLVAFVDKMLALTPKLRAATDDHQRATLQNARTATDRQIDQLVYELYDLTPEEIALVEAAAGA